MWRLCSERKKDISELTHTHIYVIYMYAFASNRDNCYEVNWTG